MYYSKCNDDIYFQGAKFHSVAKKFDDFIKNLHMHVMKGHRSKEYTFISALICVLLCLCNSKCAASEQSKLEND